MIEISNLNLFYKKVQILKNIDFAMQKNGCVCIMGESGAGKSMFAKSFIKLFDDEFKLSADKFSVFQNDILSLDGEKLREFRSKICALVFQNAKASFHPLLNVGDNFNLYLKDRINEPKKEAFEVLEKLLFDDLDILWHKYPYELSGGEASRVQIAISLCLKPKVLICDEITANLDARNQKSIIKIINSLKNEMMIIFITHQKSVATAIGDEFYTMQNGVLKNA